MSPARRPGWLALVTGTSDGIGLALTRILLAHDWTVIGVARRAAVVEHPGYRHMRVDLSDSAALVSAMEQSVAPQLKQPGWKRLGLVNNAASAEGLGPLPNLSIDLMQRIYTVNAIAPIWLIGFVTSATGPGVALRIANVSSGAATMGFPGLTAYGSSKAAFRLAEFPWVGMFEHFAEQGLLEPPEAPARELAAFLESDPIRRFTERRFGS